MAFSAALIPYVMVVEVYIVGALCVFGIAGNVLSIVVLGRDHTIRRTTGFLMQMLAVADAAFLASFLVADSLYIVLRFTDWLPADVRRGWSYVAVYADTMASNTLTASTWLVVVLTADRYVAICHPLQAAQYSTLPRLRRTVAVLWLLAVVYNIPRFLEIEVAQVETGHVSPLHGLALNGSDLVSDNSTVVDTLLNLTRGNSTPSASRHMWAWKFSAMFRNQLYQVVYRICLDSVVRYLVPLVALAFFNQRLVRALRESDQLRCHGATSGGTGRQHTWMLIVVVIVFGICQLPNMALRVCNMLHEHAGVPFSVTALQYALLAVDFILVVNSSINVVIYCFIGRQFRAILLRMVGCGGERQNARRNTEVDLGHSAVPLHHLRTPHPPEQPQSGRESPTFHQNVGDDAVCQVGVVDDVQEMKFEAELDTGGVERASTPRGDSVDNSQDVQA